MNELRPRHDPVSDLQPGSASAQRAAERNIVAQIQARLGRRRGRKPDGEAGGELCPVEPNRPLDLSGGAAAALEFDD